jgi:hypothetical protein
VFRASTLRLALALCHPSHLTQKDRRPLERGAPLGSITTTGNGFSFNLSRVPREYDALQLSPSSQQRADPSSQQRADPSSQQRAVGHFPLHEGDQRLQQMMTLERVRCPPAFPQFPASSCRALSSARARPTFATDDDTRESTMPSGFPPVPRSELIPVSSSELIPVTSIELSGTFLCTSETNVRNR